MLLTKNSTNLNSEKLEVKLASNFPYTVGRHPGKGMQYSSRVASKKTISANKMTVKFSVTKNILRSSTSFLSLHQYQNLPKNSLKEIKLFP